MIDHEERAGRLWPVLLARAKERGTISYGKAAAAIGIHHRPIRYALGPIQDFCLGEGLPRLTSLVVSNRTGVQGAGYLGDPGNQADIEEVWNFDWSVIENPFSDMHMAELDRTAKKILEDPDRAASYVSVLSRGNGQRVFRRAVYDAYNGGCCVCGLTFSNALEAAHIMPWVQGRGSLRIDPRNGLLMCANHHRLFDSNWFTISDDYVLEYSDLNEEFGPYSAADRSASIERHGSRIRLPDNERLWPDRSLLAARREENSST